MLTSRVIPCLDVRDGRVVKGVQFTGLRDMGDPAELGAMYEAQGADELALLDVSATVAGRATALETVERVRERLSIPLMVGGGVRSIEDAAALLRRGADKVSVNSAAVERPGLLDEMSVKFGAQCTVLAIDAVREGVGWVVTTRSGSRREAIDAVAWASEGAARGAGEILLTSWDRDGTREGYDLGLIAAVSEAARVPIIASGGASTSEHMREALEAGAQAVLAASIFHERETTVERIKRELREGGVEVRL